MHFIHDFLFTGAPGPGCAYSATARGTPAGPCAPNPMRDVQTDGGRGKRDKGVSAVGGGGACMERVRWRSPMLPARCQHLHRVVAYPGAHGAGCPGPASGLGGGTCLPTLPSSASREQDRPPPGLSRLRSPLGAHLSWLSRGHHGPGCARSCPRTPQSHIPQAGTLLAGGSRCSTQMGAF